MVNMSLKNTEKDCKELLNNRPLRIVHVVGALNRGGIENWLLQILQYMNRDLFKIDFVVNTTKSGNYEAEICALGCKIIRCPNTCKPWILCFRL